MTQKGRRFVVKRREKRSQVKLFAMSDHLPLPVIYLVMYRYSTPFAIAMVVNFQTLDGSLSLHIYFLFLYSHFLNTSRIARVVRNLKYLKNAIWAKMKSFGYQMDKDIFFLCGIVYAI